MKKDIHPKIYDCKVTCACGNTFVVGSTQKEMHVEICSKCHPFYTGKQKLVDSAKRVEKFESKMDKKKKMAGMRKGRKQKRVESKQRKKNKDFEIVNKKSVKIKKKKDNKKSTTKK